MLHTDITYMLWKITFPEISCKSNLTDSPSFFYKAGFKKLLNVILKMFWHLCASFEFPGNFTFCGFPRIFKQMLSCINCAFHEQMKGLSDLNDYICLSLLVSIFPFTPAEEFPTYGFNCEFGWGSHKTFCHWEHDNHVQLKWSVLTSKTGPIQDHTGIGEFTVASFLWIKGYCGEFWGLLI